MFLGRQITWKQVTFPILSLFTDKSTSLPNLKDKELQTSKYRKVYPGNKTEFDQMTPNKLIQYSYQKGSTVDSAYKFSRHFCNCYIIHKTFHSFILFWNIKNISIILIPTCFSWHVAMLVRFYQTDTWMDWQSRPNFDLKLQIYKQIYNLKYWLFI